MTPPIPTERRGVGVHSRVLFVVRDGHANPASRVRAFQLVPVLESEGCEVRVVAWRASSRRAVAVDSATIVRLAGWADVTVLLRPSLPGRLLDAVRRRSGRLVVDFDDALWASSSGRSVGQYGSRLRSAVYVADVVIAGSDHLASWARSIDVSAKVEVLRPSVDLDRAVRHQHVRDDRIVVGWVGTEGNLPELKIGVLDAISRLGPQHCTLRILSSRRPPFVSENVEFEQWTEAGEPAAIGSFDIGVLPLNDDERSRGRCAYKAIQYLAAGVPVVASPVGAAREVVAEGATGYFVGSAPEWKDAIAYLAANPSERARMGRNGRKWVAANASTRLVGQRLAHLVHS